MDFTIGIKNIANISCFNKIDEKGQTKTVNILHNIQVPEYLANYLKYLEVPQLIDDKFLLVVGDGALKAKIADVEAYNMMIGSSKKRVPSKLEFDDVAIIMMSLFTFRRIQMTDRNEDTILAIYIDNDESQKKGVYITNRKQMYGIMDPIAPKFKNKDLDDALDKIERVSKCVEQTRDKHLFAVNNGIYNSKTRELMPFSPDYVYLTKIPVDYKSQPINPVITAPDGYQWDVESWIADIADNDVEITTLIWQVIADCLQPHYSRKKSVWFYSEKGNNGKGTIGQLIKNLLGRGNYASLSVADFNHEFLKSTLIGVAANIADENDVDMYIDSVKDYKASITGDDININQKHKDPLRVQLSITNIQMMNGLPKTKDRSDSFYRRLIIVPFLKSFTNNGERTYIKNDYINRRDVLEYVLHKVLNIDFDEYIVPERSSELMADYKQDNDTVLDFWNALKDEWVWDLLPTQFVYDVYVAWDKRNNPSGKTVKQRDFNKRLVTIIEAQGEWIDSRKKNVRSNGRMDKGEPLIRAYGLDTKDRDGNYGDWANFANDICTHNGHVIYPRKDSYRGYVRL